MKRNNGHYLVLLIDENGCILNVHRNDFEQGVYHKTVLEMADSYSMKKMLSFLTTLKNEGQVEGWEINMQFESRLASLFFSGELIDKGIFWWLPKVAGSQKMGLALG
ncbi:hypothetical protein KFE98_10480 [bacterium SCSIO 12741]|nr:hypothetical protein KFE98_10480 [bacterium SCSIO 12741]